MRTDKDIDFPAGQTGKDFLFLRCPDLPGQQFCAYTCPIIQFRQGLIMLCRQNFCRRHQCSLISVFNNFCQCKCSNDCFSATYIPLYKPLHGHKPFHIAFYIHKDLFLIIRERKRNILHHQQHQLSIRRAFDACMSLFPFLPEEPYASLHKEQLLKGQTVPGPFLFFPASREMHGINRFFSFHKMVFHPHPGRKIFLYRIHML